MLLLTNHSALAYLREDLDFMDWNRYGHMFHNFAHSKMEDWDDTMYLQYPKLTFEPGDARWDWGCNASVW